MACVKRLPVLWGAAVAAAVVLGGAAAFACTNVATLGTGATGATGAKAGAAVAVEGSSFSAPEEGKAPSPVVIHWNKVDGPVLASLTPDAQGRISGSVTLPAAEPGHHVLIATQVDDKGENAFGTPARLAIEVLTPSGASVPPPAVQVVRSSSSSGGDDGVPVAVAVVLGVLAAGVLAAGVASLRKGTGRPQMVVLADAKPDREPAGRS